MAKRLRRTSAPAAPPNSSSIGGAGTGVGGPPFDPDDVPCDDPPFELHPPLELQPLLDDPFEEDEVLVEVDDPFEDDDVEVDDPFEDEEVLLDTSPLDEADEDTFPLDDEDTFPLDEDDTLPLLPPDAEEVLLVLDTPPVLVDDPPEEVEVELPPDEVDDPPDEVEVEPPVLLLVEDTTIPLDPPPPLPPPKKPPAKKPPPPNPPPPVPPTSTGPPPPNPPPESSGASGAANAGGSGTGAAWLATVTTLGAQVVVVRVTTRRTTFCRALRCATARFVTTRLVIARFVIWRLDDDSATCTAPPPMTAPPQAQAHSLASAILTDMSLHSFQNRCAIAADAVIRKPCVNKTKQTVKFNSLNHDPRSILRTNQGCQRVVRVNVP